MEFPDHNGQETTHIQQVSGPKDVCSCGGPLEIMGDGAMFIHHEKDCARIQIWGIRCRILTALRKAGRLEECPNDATTLQMLELLITGDLSKAWVWQ